MMVVMMGLDQEPIVLDSKLWCFILFPLIIHSMSCAVDIDVISSHIILGEEGEGHTITLHRSDQQ